MNKEIKEQARHTAKLVPESQRELFLSEIDSLIDRTVQMTEERIINKSTDIVARHLYNNNNNNDLCVRINKDIQALITNKSDINN